MIKIIWENFGGWPGINAFFDNSTVAILIASILALSAYKKQKELDQKFEIKKDFVNTISLMTGQIDEILLILDQSYNTKKLFNVEIAKINELTGKKLSDLVNNKIAMTAKNLDSLVYQYLFEDREILNAYETHRKHLKIWHEKIVIGLIDGSTDIFSLKPTQNTEINALNIFENLKQFQKFIRINRITL